MDIGAREDLVALRVIILSERWSHLGREYLPPSGVTLDIVDLNNADGLAHSVFDYDVSIIHITRPRYHSIGYYKNLAKLHADAELALTNGRTVICLPASQNFLPKQLNHSGDPVYQWVLDLGVPLKDNEGVDIRPSQSGRSQVIRDYLGYAPRYYQTVRIEAPQANEILAVVGDTQIVVGISHPLGNGKLVILPPPDLSLETYADSLNRLIDVGSHYNDISRRHIALADAPDWLDRLRVPRAKEISEQMEALHIEKSKYDLISYALFGTGDELEDSVEVILKDLGLSVEKQPTGANIDFKALHPTLNLAFTLEITGTTGIIRKESNKVSQCWQHISDRAGNSEASDRLVLVANTECHLDPSERTRDPFSRDAANLLADNGVLLLTTVELYGLWSDVHEGLKTPEDVVQQLHRSSGRFDLSGR